MLLQEINYDSAIKKKLQHLMNNVSLFTEASGRWVCSKKIFKIKGENRVDRKAICKLKAILINFRKTKEIKKI